MSEKGDVLHRSGGWLRRAFWVKEPPINDIEEITPQALSRLILDQMQNPLRGVSGLGADSGGFKVHTLIEATGLLSDRQLLMQKDLFDNESTRPFYLKVKRILNQFVELDILKIEDDPVDGVTNSLGMSKAHSKERELYLVERRAVLKKLAEGDLTLEQLQRRKDQSKRWCKNRVG